jgi:hypothetical protein
MRPLRLGFCSAMLVSALVALPAASTASSKGQLALAIFDDAQTLQHPAATFATLKKLHVQVARITLNWSTIASRKPAAAGDPNDPAYHWKQYDQAVQQASRRGIEILFTIWGTPSWANGGKPARYAPIRMQSLFNFTFAAATRYDGVFVRSDGMPLPHVPLWLAWNEPNNPLYLLPQYNRSNGKWMTAATTTYAKICTAIYDGVHAAQEHAKVACGATAPRGDNSPENASRSISPLLFLRGVKAAGLKQFDAWAHQPYYGRPSETPATRPGQGAVELGNFNTLVSELTRLYGQRRVWITQYGYETSPPDRVMGVGWTEQARYLRQAYLLARANPRVDLFTWFMLDDDADVSGGSQSGLLTADGLEKPAFGVLQRLTH